MTSEIVIQAAHEMDQAIENVMPDHWEGHARTTIRERDDLSHDQQEFAVKLATRLIDKGKTSDAEKAALAAIKQAQKKL